MRRPPRRFAAKVRAGQAPRAGLRGLAGELHGHRPVPGPVGLRGDRLGGPRRSGSRCWSGRCSTARTPTTCRTSASCGRRRRGPGERYVKQHLVPFGEYIPFRGILTHLIGRLKEIPRDFAPGDRVGVLHIGGTTIGDLMCFEVAYDDLVRSIVDDGGQADRGPDEQRDVRRNRPAGPAVRDLALPGDRERAPGRRRLHRRDQRLLRRRTARCWRAAPCTPRSCSSARSRWPPGSPWECGWASGSTCC